MPNPTITPWAPGATFAVSGSSFAAIDINVADIANAPATIVVTAPGGATVHALRNPATWNAAGTELLGAGGWTAGAISIDGVWDVAIADGAAPTDPATITVSDPAGVNADGILRLVARNLAGMALTVEVAGGMASIDRVLANPSITSPQVTSGLPVEELDNVTLTAGVQLSQSVNPAPALPLAAAPPLVSAWTPAPGNPAAVSSFVSNGSNASFTAPAAYQTLPLDFTISAALNLDGGGLGSPSNPRNQETLAVSVTVVTHAMVLVIDRSGSMGASFGGTLSRWDAAVRAAHSWLDLFRAFRPGDAHKAGIVTFEHDTCGWTASAADDVTLRNPANGAAAAALTSLPAFGNAAQLNLGTEQSCTPVGDGLVTAFGKLGDGLLAGSGGKRGSVLLLTDGYENAGRVTIAASKGSAAATFAEERAKPALSFANGLIGPRLFTLAVGSQVDEDRLNDLGDGFYQLVDKSNQVLPAFAEMLGDVLDAQRVMPVGAIADPDTGPNGNAALADHALYFPVSAGEQKVAFLVPWSSALDDLAVAWRDQGDATQFFTPVDPTANGVQYFRRQGHGLLVAPIGAVTGGTLATEWRLQHRSGGAAQPMTDADALCMVDLALKAEVAFDQRHYYIGDAMRLSCRIVHGGVPVLGARVLVDVARPGEGLGTFLATNSGLYKRMQADLPSDITKRADTLKGKGHMHATLLHLLKLEQLPVVTPPTLELYDDGNNDDGAADDGDYANLFSDTLKEGTYTFRFRIEGILPDGSRFTRLFTRSTWVGVRPDPSLLNPIWDFIEDDNGWTVAMLTFKPATLSGELLGPFRHDAISMRPYHARFDGALIDNLDGTYARRLRFLKGAEPIISIDVYGTPMLPTGPYLPGTTGTLNKSCWQLWRSAMCCTVDGILRMLGLRK